MRQQRVTYLLLYKHSLSIGWRGPIQQSTKSVSAQRSCARELSELTRVVERVLCTKASRMIFYAVTFLCREPCDMKNTGRGSGGGSGTATAQRTAAERPMSLVIASISLRLQL